MAIAATGPALHGRLYLTEANTETKVLTREELYELVWSEPMRKLAERFQLSDVGLKKACTRHRIPVPARGHWQRVQAGKASPRIPLPILKEARPITFMLNLPPPEPSADPGPDPAVEAEQDFPPIVVGELLERPYPVVRRMRKELKTRKPDDYGAIRSIEPDALSVRIHPATTERALRIADALLRAFELRRFELRPGKRGARFGGSLQVVVDGEAFTISIEERMRRESHKPTAEEQSRRRRGLYVYSRTYDYAPTGELTLKIEPSYGTGLQSTWRDTRHSAIEQRLGEVMVSLRQHAAWRKAERDKAKERQERLQLELQRRAELRARVEAERQAVGKLEEQAESWRRAEQIRAYVAAAERCAGALSSREQAEWVEWARAYADRLDPLRPSPHSVLDTPESEFQPIALWQL